MAVRGVIRQYYILLTCLQRGHYPSKAMLTEQLAAAGFTPSGRTVERYLEQLRDEFGLDYTYNARRRGYGLEHQIGQKEQQVRNFLERLLIGELLTQEVTGQTDVINYLSFDTDAAYTGIAILRQLLFAMRHRRVVAFEHHSYQRDGPVHYESFQPYFLKEYQNRWYLVGQEVSEAFPRVLGTDRIERLNIQNDTFTVPTNAPSPQTFAHLIGVSEFYKSTERVRLAFARSQSPYLKSLPWHPSQQIVEETETECVLELTVTPNYELCQRILAQGAKVRVLEPDWLRTKIRAELEAALKNW